MRPLLLCAILSSASMLGQGVSVVGAGYSNPAVIRVAPGQIIKLYLAGASPIFPPGLRTQRADSVPLPSTLAGFSVSFRSGTASFAAAMLAVEQNPLCLGSSASSSPECFTTALTIQVPFEIMPRSLGPTLVVTHELVIDENGIDSRRFWTLPANDNIHVVTACDKPAGPVLPATIPELSYLLNPCSSIVTHADGTPVSAESPAKPGETVIIYAFGLGQVTPAVKTGEATPLPAPVLYSDSPFFNRTVDLQFDFRVNASPSRPYLNPAAIGPDIVRNPRFVGLTPGEVGLYQINVRLPDAFPPVDRCTSSRDRGTLSSIFFPVLSNLTISLAGGSSFDGAAICVQPQLQ